MMLLLQSVTLTADVSYVKQAAKGSVFTIFTIPNCAFSAIARPKFEAVEDKFSDLQLFEFDCSQDFEYCKKIGVLGYPTFKLYNDRKMIGDFHPTWPRELEVFVEWLKMNNIK
ncbi:Protein disulfide isomerase [Spironucleus salmonicida]|uniref:Protein disulfide isomerase n=1 Tax=Spironucleus salmonicida TaxID=348837 RepID=V6LNP9_9EUKA|nr:Protein disulfide isomerase [Spironucleus salmonicida]KAH0577247.1 Protein disulfide isomerase [Spironucleus salmonicida]|eukprot:EST45868.1 Thioredoxin domain-containing protein [Spironucleus salmonicida]